MVMASVSRQGDPPIDFVPDPVLGFAYCRELPPDVPPGMTLREWRHGHRRGRHHHHPLRRVRPAPARARGAVGCHVHRNRPQRDE
jgi:hypothetical protein